MRIRLDCCLFGVKRDSLTRLYAYTSTLHRGCTVCTVDGFYFIEHKVLVLLSHISEFL